MLYQYDSFFTLPPGGQAGLLPLSIVLTAVAFWFAERLFRIFRKFPRPLEIAGRVGCALAVIWLFVWLTPQIYYFYYQITFEGLPWQFVIRQFPDSEQILALLTFTGKSTLSAHGKGILAWGLIAYAIGGAVWRRDKTRSRPDQ